MKIFIWFGGIVLDSDEERPDVIGLRKMLIETLMQRRKQLVSENRICVAC